MAAWNSLPPQRPRLLRAYLGRIKRNFSLKRLRNGNTRKRGGGALDLIYEELENCIAAEDGPEKSLEEKELIQAVETFLAGLSRDERLMFLYRYWLAQPVAKIAARMGCKPARVNSALYRSRQKLRDYLEKEGLQDSKEFLVYQEFMAFHDDYVAHDYYGDQMPQEQDEWMRQHERIYFVYTQRLKDKLIELSEKYGLKLRSDVYEDSGAQWCTALGLKDFIGDPRFCEDDAAFLAYDDDSFLMQIGWSGAPGEYLDCSITRNVRGYFSQGYVDFDAEEIVRQWNYTTGKGTEVTIFWGTLHFYIIYDGPEAFVVASIARWVNDEAFSEEVVTAIANAIDFETLGKVSQVNLSLGKSRPVEPVQMDAQMRERQQLIEGRKQAEIGQWLENYNGLEFRVDSIQRSTNLREEGWQMDQFIPDSMGWVDGVCYTYPDWANPETGELKEGLCLITVALTAKNTNVEDSTAEQTLNNTGFNNFSNSLLFLDFAAISDGVFCQVTKGADAWSGKSPIPGQSAFVHIEPGETLSYRLAYIAPAELKNMVFFTFDSCLPLPSAE